MPALEIAETLSPPPPPARAVYRLEGRFDDAAALRLRNALANEHRPAVELDFSHVTSFEDRTLALLTVTVVLLHRRNRTVRLLGITEHQRRLLHHFGIVVTGDGSAQFLLHDDQPFTD